MLSSSSDQQQLSWGFVLVMLFLITLVVVLVYIDRTSEQKAIKTLTSIHLQEVTSFKIHPEKTYTEDYHDAIEFRQEEELVEAFFYAITDSLVYKPQHDRALASWGMQIRTDTHTLRIGCYIPDLASNMVVGSIVSKSGSGMFQSYALLRWYQKYGHHWKASDYLKVQYGRVKSNLTSLSPENITSLWIVPNMFGAENRENPRFRLDSSTVTEFFQALADMHFAIPMYQNNILTQWKLQIYSHSSTVSIECSIPTENANMVICGIDSQPGYSYFQSRELLEWYHKHSHRWLEPEEAPPPPTPQPDPPGGE